MQGEILTDQLLQSLKVAKVNKEHTRTINSIDFDNSGGLCLTSSDDESIRVYSCNSGKLHNTIYSKKYGCSLAKFTHRSNNIIYCSTKTEDSIRYMSLHDNKYLRYFKGHTKPVVSLEMSPGDDTFASASVDSTIRFWDLRNPQSTV
jgi:COMPASS component SWD2